MSAPVDRDEDERTRAERIRALAARAKLSEAWAASMIAAGFTVEEIRASVFGCTLPCDCGAP